MRHWIAFLLLLALSICPRAMAQEPPQRVLFVGNSLTYYGNLPATFAAMAEANGHPLQAAMLVEAGATLQQRVADGSALQALATYQPDVVVLQERGGDLMGWPDEQAGEQSRQAIRTLAQAGRDAGARVLLLGTYQSNPQASAVLVEQEGDAAKDAGIAYVEVSESLRRLSGTQPALVWHATDGMHPGPALTLLDAIQLHRSVFGSLPTQGFEVAAPIYADNSGLHAELRNADAPAPHPENTPQGSHYDKAQIEQLGALLEH